MYPTAPLSARRLHGLDANQQQCDPPAMKYRLASGLLLLGLASCRPPPAEVVVEARSALASGKMTALLPWLAADARALLAAEPKIASASGKLWRVLPDGRLPATLLPAGEVVRTVELGQRAVVTIQRGRTTADVPLRLERGQWRLDLLAMPGFWRTLL